MDYIDRAWNDKVGVQEETVNSIGYNDEIEQRKEIMSNILWIYKFSIVIFGRHVMQWKWISGLENIW